MNTDKSTTDRHLYPTRLFNVKTQQFTHALRKDYAILSHRWSDNEISYRDLANGTYNQSLASYHKFDGFCLAAEVYGCQYIWVDSACIDQTDEEELDKSIQSMFSWYQNAKVCIIHLADAFSIEEISQSSWFTRGWTLQEFLAPRRMVFYFGDWTRVSLVARFDVIRQGDYFIHDDESAYDDGSYGEGDFDEGEEGTKLRDLIMTAAGEYLLKYSITIGRRS
ncbi:hypothetical protein ONZ45_g7252 [Pleurotus djamor]|nr:hypothetical protein ONZ45_g7252 [Pleurotus djamor]